MSRSEWNTQHKKKQQTKEKILKNKAVEVLRAETERWQVEEKPEGNQTTLAQLTNIFFGICNSILILLCFSQYCFHVSSVKP